MKPIAEDIMSEAWTLEAEKILGRRRSEASAFYMFCGRRLLSHAQTQATRSFPPRHQRPSHLSVRLLYTSSIGDYLCALGVSVQLNALLSEKIHQSGRAKTQLTAVSRQSVPSDIFRLTASCTDLASALPLLSFMTLPTILFMTPTCPAFRAATSLGMASIAR